MVIINADDFGMNEHCSKAIAEAFLQGLVSDTTMTANGEYFSEAAALAKKCGFFDKIGIHLNLTEGKPLTDDIQNFESFVTNGRFNKSRDWSVKLSPKEQCAVYKELSAQIKRMLDAGIRITHADSHHYVHNFEAIAPTAIKVCKEYGITKIRLRRNLGALNPDEKAKASEYNAWLKKQGFATTENFGRMIDSLSAPVPDNTELLVHPDFDKDGVLIDRRGVKDGFPTGVKLISLTESGNINLGEYSKIN